MCVVCSTRARVEHNDSGCGALLSAIGRTVACTIALYSILRESEGVQLQKGRRALRGLASFKWKKFPLTPLLMSKIVEIFNIKIWNE